MRKRRIVPLMAVLVASLACSFLAGGLPHGTTPTDNAPSLATVEAAPSVTPLPALPTAQPPRPQRENPADHAGEVRRDVTYCVVDGLDLKMDLYFPKNATGVTPLVAYIHGGGWSQGSKSGGAGLIDAPALLDAGFTVASLDYRLAPQYKFPAMIEDVKCAIRSLRAHAADYHINPDRIGVWGGSAGGHLVSLLGASDTSAGFDAGQYLDQSSRVQAVVDMFGPADLTIGFSDAYLKLRDTVFGGFDLAEASPVAYVTPDDPPFLILQGDRDQTVPPSQSQEFYDKLTAAGVEAQLVIVTDGPHGLISPYEYPSREDLTALIVQFFTEKLK